MENKVLNANLDQIKRYNTTLANEILRIEEIKSNLVLIQNENGEYNLTLNSIPLHSSTGAADEAKNIVAKIEENKDAIRVVYGLGLGYLADEFISAKKGAVIIYEPNLDILRATLEVVEFSENLKNENVFVCATKEALLETIGKISTRESKITVSFLNSYFNFFENDIREVAKLIETENGRKHANLNTFKILAPNSVSNSFYSLKNIEKAKLLNDTTVSNAPKTAIIASAGPSLAENIETIKKNRDKFTLFTVGPAAKLLIDNGITPDFLCVLEVSDTRGQLENLDLSNVNLIFEPFSAKFLWDLKVKDRFLFFSKNNFLNDWSAKILGLDISENFSLGTVSYCALSCARKMGFKKIILCGQNLAFKDGSCYAKGSAFEDLECILNEDTQKFEIRAKDLEKYAKKLLGENWKGTTSAKESAQNYLNYLNTTIYTVMGQDGKMLPTQAGYALFIKDFEEFAKSNEGEIEFINSSTGGAQINGYENIELSKALEMEEDTSGIILNTNPRVYNKEKIEELLKTFKIVAEELEIMAKKVRELVDEEKKELTRRKAITKNCEKLRFKRIELAQKIRSLYQRNEVLHTLCMGTVSEILVREEKLNKEADFKNYSTILEEQKKDVFLLRFFAENFSKTLMDV